MCWIIFCPQIAKTWENKFQNPNKGTWHGTSSMRITCNTFALPKHNILHYVTNGLYVTPSATQQVPMLRVRKKENTWDLSGLNLHMCIYFSLIALENTNTIKVVVTVRDTFRVRIKVRAGTSVIAGSIILLDFIHNPGPLRRWQILGTLRIGNENELQPRPHMVNLSVSFHLGR